MTWQFFYSLNVLLPPNLFSMVYYKKIEIDLSHTVQSTNTKYFGSINHFCTLIA